MRIAASALLLALVSVFAAEPAEAHGRARVSVGVGFGFGPYWGPGWGPWWYPPPYYYPPQTIVVPSQPVTYIERGNPEVEPRAAEPAPSTESWWYYCHDPRGYYPYVKACPSGWARVPPGPPPAPR